MKRSPEVLMKSHPTNELELQLFRLLQRANLLIYYDSFIQNGGDDVQQLYDAYRQQSTELLKSMNEEEKTTEFIEIMKTVGMTKPLHVMRLQKALREWGANPVEFQQPVTPAYIGGMPDSNILNSPHSVPFNSINNSNSQTLMHNIQSSTIPTTSISAQFTPINTNMSNLSMNKALISPSINNASNSSSLNSPSILNKPTCTITRSSLDSSKSPTVSQNESYKIQTNLLPTTSQSTMPVNQLIKSSSTDSLNNCLNLKPNMNTISNSSLNNGMNNFKNLTSNSSNLTSALANSLNLFVPIQSNGHSIDNEQMNSNSPICMTHALDESEVQKIIEAALETIKEKDFKTKFNENLKTKNHKNHRNVEHIFKMSEDDPRRVDEIRKYASIYGRFDCKRKPEKPLSMHELHVNEAALQLCKLRPILLTNRQFLFSWARRTVHKAGYHYQKGRSRGQYTNASLDPNESDLQDNSQNNDSIDIITFNEDDDEKEFSHESSDTSNAGKSDIPNNRNEFNNGKHFEIIKDQNSKFINQLVNTKTNNFNNATSSNNGIRSSINYEEKNCKLDHLDMISKQIENYNEQIEDLSVQLESNESEIIPQLLKLKDDQKLLIEKKNNLVKQIQKLDSSRPVSTNNFNSEEDTNSQASIHSHTSSKNEQQSLIDSKSPVQIGSPISKNVQINLELATNNQSQTSNENNSFEFNRSTLKRKLILESNSPHKNKINRIQLNHHNALFEEDNHESKHRSSEGLDLRVSYSNKKDK